ncbi:unnamed protein product [Phytophthora lilii]|uniref:Unnamed protein product n=1 Tax=Phytophthora lilii TaxID=2077276 RepID=A0A9W6U1H5_9STRA|nr:unnamed protein product [Phytophthora lilii]
MSSENMLQKVLSYLIQRDGGWKQALEVFLQCSTDVEGDLRLLLEMEHIGRVSDASILHFVNELPQVEWIVAACDIMLQNQKRWDVCMVASMLFEAMGHATGNTLMLAEICWIQRLNFSIRAIVSSAPVTITSCSDRNMLYVGSPGNGKCGRPILRGSKRVLENKRELWRFVPITTTYDGYRILNVGAPEYIFSSCDVMNYSSEKEMARVCIDRQNHTSVKHDEWRLKQVEGCTYTLYNPKKATFLAVSAAVDGCAGPVVTTAFRPLDERWSSSREWLILAAAPPMLELGLDQFFLREYSAAANTFGRVLATTNLSFNDFKKTLCYRAAASLLLRNEGCYEHDLSVLAKYGETPDVFFDTLGTKLTTDDRWVLRRRPVFDPERLIEY